MICSKELGNGRTAFGCFDVGALVRLIEDGSALEGDIIDVFNGTVQLVVNAHIPSGELGRYSVETVTKNDRGKLEVINYQLVDNKVVGVSKRQGDLRIDQDKKFAIKYWKAIAA